MWHTMLQKKIKPARKSEKILTVQKLGTENIIRDLKSMARL
jgi:hypothetical protein